MTLTPTQLFFRFVKEERIYIQAIQYLNSNLNVYDGCIEDKLNREKTTIKELFPLPLIGNMNHTKLIKNWTIFLEQNNINGNTIPKPSENWSTIPDKIFDEFYSVYGNIELYKEAFDKVIKLKTRHKSIGRYLRMKHRLIDDLFGESPQKATLSQLWLGFLIQKNICAWIY